MATQFPTIQHSLNGGEVSERFGAGRQDQNKRQSGVARSENWLPLTVGGLRRREGSVTVAQCKVVADHPIKRSVRFVASNDAAYVIEMGHLYMRFFRDGVSVASELTTPYADTDLAALNTEAQSIDVKYFFHPSYPPYKLSRTSATSFTFAAAVFSPPATVEEEPTGTNLGGGTLTPGATTGVGVNFNASLGAPFKPSDVGRLILSGAARAVIASYVSAVQVTADILDAFPSTAAIPATSWRLKLPPQTTIDVQDKRKEVGEVAILTAALPAFRPQDVGKWITIFGGLVQIDVVDSDPTLARGTIKSQLKDIDSDNPAPTRAWTLEVAAWSATRGYPSCGTFFKDRLWVFKGLTCNGSKSADFENFSKGAGDDDAIARTISDDDIDSIVWAKALTTLFAGTGSGVFEIHPPTEGAAITPNNCTIDLVTNRGCAKIPPVRISGLMHYVQYGQRRLRELVFDFATNKFVSPNLFQLSEHLTESYYLTELCFAPEPDSFVYAVRSDGQILVLVYQEDEKVLGWARITTQGTYKSICSIPRPSTGNDWVWYIVERENGTYIEYFEPSRPGTNREWSEAQTDAAVFTTHNANFVVTGLSHLEGQSVRVIGDGILYDDAVVSGGSITLSPAIACDVVEVGLNYDSDGLTLPPIIPAELGGPMIAAAYAEVGVRFRRTLGLEINGETIVHRVPVNPMDTAVPLQKGTVSVHTLKGDEFNRISFKQTKPFPTEILNVFGRLKTGDKWENVSEDDGTPPFQFIEAI